MKKKITVIFLIFMAIAAMTTIAVRGQATGSGLKRGDGPKDTLPKIAVAYVEDYRKGTPDPHMFTHLIYSFLRINDTFDGIVVRYPEKLQSLVDLKKENPELKIMVSIGGDKAGGFSEMAANKKKRKAFANAVKHLVDSLGLDGVDLDWEFPTVSVGGTSASPEDEKNYVLLAKDLRKALGKKAWLSYYSNHGGKWIDHKRMLPYVSYVHVSGYNLAIPKEGEQAYHQSPLYASSKTGGWCVKRSIERHIELGVPKEKIMMGIPFFGRGKSPFPTYAESPRYDQYAKDCKVVWDKDSQAPYFADDEGNLVMGFDNEQSIKAKFDFIRANGLPGVFVWNYDADYPDHRLGKTIERLRK
ncbi:MAG: hypothetical protein K2H72_02940 [Muribaculaceae bacterium]|nr:hypothetical protein [Muribaculaceae bacterium]